MEKNMWQAVGAEKITHILQTKLNPERIELKGSVLNPETIDIFSDVDISVFLGEVTEKYYNVIISTLSIEISDVLGYEIHNNVKQDILRICLGNGWRFDITFEYRTKKPLSKNDNNNDVFEKVVNEFWFKSAMIMMKIGRNDYLIAAHLSLELCQLNIVMQMLERDYMQNTNIHRFGGKESAFLPLAAEDCTIVFSKDKKVNHILQIVFHATGYMDELAVKFINGYSNRNNTLHNIYCKYLGEMIT